MKVLNKTNKELKIRIKDRYGHMYSIYLPGGRSVNLEPNQVSRDVLDFIKSGVLKEVDATPSIPTKIEPIKTVEEAPVLVECACEHTEQTVSVEMNVEPPIPATTIENDTEEEVSGSSLYTCEFCGSEFASFRGLSMHKNRSHTNELNKEV